MKRKRRLLLSLLGLLVLLFLSPAACQSVAKGVVDGKLGPCPDSPNCVNSEFPEAASAIAPLAFTGDPAAALISLVDFLRAEPRTDVVEVTETYAHVVFRTALMRYRDDVEFRLDPEASVIHVRSASRMGYSDLGTNRDRVESIRSRWTQEDE